jgi:hypothetical protein
MFWKALPGHDPTKLDSTPNLNPTAGGDFLKIKYTPCHSNYFSKTIDPKIGNPVRHAS